MLYAAVRPVAKIGLRHYFRRIDLANTENIPKNAAVILAANHPTTFIEPCILACYLEEPLHFLARGDFFKNPIAAKLLSGVHIIPVFRLRDGGIEKVKTNYESFDRSHQVLAQHKTLMILADGRCIHEKRLRPIRKGTARIALGAIDNTDLEEVYIVPVGVNFTYPERVRSDVMINCGKAIKASDYFADYQESPSHAINKLTQELQDRLAAEVVIIDDIRDEPLVENLLRIYRTENPVPLNVSFTNDNKQLRAEKQIADRVNALAESEKSALAALTHDYFSRLQRMRVSDAAFNGNYRAEQKRTSTLFLGILPALLVLCWHLPPVLFSQWFAGVKIKTLEFAGPVKWSGLLITYMIYSLIWLVLAITLSSWWPLLLLVIGLFSARPLIRYAELGQRWLEAWRVRRQAEHERTYLKNIRREILAKTSEFWSDAHELSHS
jgi:1-acyl-sn-glycerol-3-phosphate acyltransferase